MDVSSNKTVCILDLFVSNPKEADSVFDKVKNATVVSNVKEVGEVKQSISESVSFNVMDDVSDSIVAFPLISLLFMLTVSFDIKSDLANELKPVVGVYVIFGDK